MDKLDMATSPCDGLRCHSARTRTLPSAMRNTKVFGRASLDEQNFAPESGSLLSLSLRTLRFRPRCV